MSNRRTIQIAQPVTGEAEWEATRAPIETGWLTQGPKVAEFEKQFAARHGVRHAIATSSCTTGLHLILAALEIGPGDEVIVPAFTWIATANVVRYCGATPVFADVDPVTFNIDTLHVAKLVTQKTRAILPVHLFGLCADMEALKQITRDLPLIEDAACAVGAGCRGAPAGGLGTAAAFSFHPRKIITTGEGGMVTTNDDALAERMIQMRNHGASISEEARHLGPAPYLLPEFNILGFNYRMTDLQGAVGVEQLKRLDELLEQRRHWARYYQSALGDIRWLRAPHVPDGYDHSWQSYVCWVNETLAPAPRNKLMERLQELGISTRPGTHAVTDLGYYRSGQDSSHCPQATRCSLQTMAIPLHNKMVREDFDYIISALQTLSS